MKIGGWHHIALPVPDLERSVAWYEDVLFGHVYRRTDVDPRDVAANRNRQAWLTVGDTIVNLAESTPVRREPEQHFFHYALTTTAGDLDAWMVHLHAHEVPVLGPYGHGGLSFLSIYFDDPDGYRWELIVDYADFDSARVAALAHGGKLGNPTAAYDWES